jgi:hypothetical protein
MIVSNIFCELPSGDFNRRSVIILSEKGNHSTASIAGASVIDDWFNAVADFYSIFAIVGSDEKQDAGIFFFGASAKVPEEIDGVIFDWTIVERFDGDDGHLRAGFLFELGAECFQVLLGGWRNDSGEIGDVACGRNSVDVVAEGGRRSKKNNRKSEKNRKAETHYVRLEHNPLKPKTRVTATGISIAIFEQKCKRGGNERVRSIQARKEKKRKDNAETRRTRRTKNAPV